jgi:hypothetical protein
MKSRRFGVALVLLFLALAVPASAQELGYFGLGPRVGVSNNPDQIVAGMQFNFGEFVPHLRFQPNFELATGDDHDIISITAPVHYRFVVEGNVVPYAGGGLTVAWVNVDLPRGRSDSDFEIAATGVGGVEWPMRDHNAFFLELNVGFGDIQDVAVMAGWMFGGGGEVQRPAPAQP